MRTFYSQEKFYSLKFVTPEGYKECYRILKPGGILIINDWLSCTKGKWGGYVQRLVELEGLSIYAETVEEYLNQLEEASFTKVKHVNLSKQYAIYNDEIVEKLNIPEKKQAFIHSFNENLHEEAIEGYESIANALRLGEGMVIQFTAYKD